MSKNKIIIVLPKVDIFKETKEERKVRVNCCGSAMFSKVVPNKKRLDKKKQRQQDKKEVSNYNV